MNLRQSKTAVEVEDAGDDGDDEAGDDEAWHEEAGDDKDDEAATRMMKPVMMMKLMKLVMMKPGMIG